MEVRESGEIITFNAAEFINIEFRFAFTILSLLS